MWPGFWRGIQTGPIPNMRNAQSHWHPWFDNKSIGDCMSLRSDGDDDIRDDGWIMIPCDGWDHYICEKKH